MSDADETIDQYERLLDLDVKAANDRETLRRRVQDKSLEMCDAVMGLASQQQAIEIARKLASDPTP